MQVIGGITNSKPFVLITTKGFFIFITERKDDMYDKVSTKLEFVNREQKERKSGI